MRFHVLGLAHVPTNKIFEPCAYTQKIIRLCDMLMLQGNEVLFYGNSDSAVNCTELIPVLTPEDRKRVYGDYNWKKEFFKHDPRDEAHQLFNKNAILEINKRKRVDDILCVTMGNYQKPISDAVGLTLTSESGIGYEGIYTAYKVFESYAWMHHLYGLIQQKDGNYFDTVIPNCYNSNEFIYQKKKEDYFLFIGRFIWRKGIQVAFDTMRIIGKKLLLAGQGDLNGINTKDVDFEVLGTVTGEEKKRLFAGATATFVPTIYIGPFEGVSVESMFSGTPVITSDWGVFTETVPNGVVGYRCRMLRDFVQAAQNCIDKKIDSSNCLKHAVDNFSTLVGSDKYQKYYSDLSTLLKDGWYTK
jgi:glycosyltransferase involved in cell wall biosynthesis